MRVIVVGAGIVGASAAWHLAAQDVDVVLIDRADAGQATAAGAGVVAPWLLRPDTPAPVAALGLGAAAHYPLLLDALAAAGMGEHGYALVGGIHVAPDGPELEQMHQGLLQLRAQPGMAGLGVIERLGPGEPAARFPPLRGDLAGLAVGGIGRVDGRMLRDALLGAAAARGARRRTGQATLTQDTVTGRVGGVAVDGEALAADAVVVAAGAWSSELCRPLGVRLPVVPQRGQLLHLDLPGRDTGTAGWPVIRTTGDHYLLAFPGGRVVAGSTRESGTGFDHRVTLGGVHQVAGNALTLAPGLADATLAEVRVGFRPLTPDGLALLGGIDGAGGLVVATGLGPVGLTLGPYVGALAADLALDKDVPLDLAPYRPDRRIQPG